MDAKFIEDLARKLAANVSPTFVCTWIWLIPSR